MSGILVTAVAWAALLGASARSGSASSTPPVAEAPSAPIIRGVELRVPEESNRALLQDAPDLVAVRKGQRLSQRAVRRSIERLFATGRFADVVVRAVAEHDGGVTVVFEVEPKQQVVSVVVRGNKVLREEEILSATRFDREVEYWPERVDEAIAAIVERYRLRGYEHARAEVELAALTNGLEVTFQVAEGVPTRVHAVHLAGSPGLPLPQLLQALGTGVGQVLDLDELERGRERLRELLREKAYYRASVGEPTVQHGSEGAIVMLPLYAGPQYELHFHGNRSFPDPVLRGIVKYDGAELLDRSVMGRLARRIETFYRFKGYYEVRVQARETRSPNERHGIVAFVISEGPPIAVKELAFVGNRAVPAAELRELLTDFIRAREPIPVGDVHANDDPLELEGRTAPVVHGDLPAPEPATIFIESAYREAADAMTQVYRDRGYLTAKVQLAAVAIDVERREARVRFAVEEGPRAVLRGTVALRGLPTGFDVRDLSGLQEGEAFSYARLESARMALTRQLGRLGWIFAHVEGAAVVSESGTSAKVSFDFAPGPRVRVGKVLVQGLRRTREHVVRNSLGIREGDLLDPETLYDAQRNLVQLGIFRTVAVRLIAPDAVEPIKDVVIEAVESSRVSGEIAGGYFLAEGPRVVIDLAASNLAGLAINLSGHGKINYVGGSAPVLTGQMQTGDLSPAELVGGRATLTAQNRGLLPADVGMRVDLIAERVLRPYYRFNRAAMVPGLDWSTYVSLPRIDWARLRTNVTLQYELEGDSVSTTGAVGELLPVLTRLDQERLRFPRGDFVLHSLRLAPAVDLRDDPANPHKGFLFSLSGERVWDIFTRDELGQTVPVQLLKVSGTLTGYIPLTKGTVLALSARGGRIFSLRSDSVTPPVKRFFLGGASSMRGFPEDGLLPADTRADLSEEVNACRSLASRTGCTTASRALLDGTQAPSGGGELYSLGKAELRFPASGALELGVFFEAGNLWLAQTRYEPLALRYVAGAGLRYPTPIGPLALDVGTNLLPDTTVNEPRFNVHFNIGLF